ncbi:hypothetical protein AZ78_4014 [Lysobacter capsici AZ78]|uniref:Uncharacterized protein n=1 Tax=Lysobacter capsici AZ78 TaxID=1444315 RepID=A0A120AHN2_9GAMM|nr:hypothetical protein [Lysobacter capsici]KWS06458.1 hypothetical protein AZ78_4014 [Lysobacter capsici AZ78]WND79718.1 hypothetical protein RJ610_20885 [Lysobacter capsici]WND84914.1 hypothetical protein RJ609_20900 [Lysobacter capsici]
MRKFFCPSSTSRVERVDKTLAQRRDDKNNSDDNADRALQNRSLSSCKPDALNCI